MNVGEAIGLGAVQGLTEFLPVSSSGHLVIGHRLLGATEPELFFDLVCHVGTLLAVLAYYARDLARLAREALLPGTSGAGALTWDFWNRNPARRFLLAVVACTIPTGIIGLALEDFLERAFASPFAVGWALLLTTAAVASTRFSAARRQADPAGAAPEQGTLTVGRGALVGVVQGLAVMPGLSRSGSTIAAALALGARRKEAARFSFLASVPAVAGAALLKGLKADWAALDPAPLLAGFLASAVTGLAALVLLVRLVERGRFHWFAFYTLPAALFALWLGRNG